MAAVKGIGLDGIVNGVFTTDDLLNAITNFGEGNKQYGIAILDCSDALKSGDFEAATDAIDGYRLGGRIDK